MGVIWVLVLCVCVCICVTHNKKTTNFHVAEKVGKIQFSIVHSPVRRQFHHHNFRCAQVHIWKSNTHITKAAYAIFEKMIQFINLPSPPTQNSYTHTHSFISPLFTNTTYRYAVPRVSRKHCPERPHWRMKPFWCTDFYIVRICFIICPPNNQLKCLCVYICCTCPQCDRRLNLQIYQIENIPHIKRKIACSQLSASRKLRNRATNPTQEWTVSFSEKWCERESTVGRNTREGIVIIF